VPMLPGPALPCHRLIHPLIHHVWPLALRGIRRAMRRHAHHAVAAGLTIVCATPPVVLWMVPAPLTVPWPTEQVPVPVPEPAGVWVFCVGVAVVVWLRRRRA
jgi:hypothetical protein